MLTSNQSRCLLKLLERGAEVAFGGASDQGKKKKKGLDGNSNFIGL